MNARVIDKTLIAGKWFAGYSGDTSWAQCEHAGLSLRIGRHHVYFGRNDYRDKSCPWPQWARVRICLFRPD